MVRMIKLLVLFLFFLGVGMGVAMVSSPVWAQGVYVSPGFYSPNVIYSNRFVQTPVLIYQRPAVIIERRGSNDWLYESDNVYGSGASAAGRMSRTVVNPQPQYYLRGF